jgi:branched-chain amino acid aminotransferase
MKKPQLQKPPFVFMNGTLTPWDEARIHVSTEAVIRGISVFEGIKGYWDHTGKVFSLLELRRHYRRLVQSAAMMRLPFDTSYEDFATACHAISRTVLQPDKDLWCRPTVLPIEGGWGHDTQCDLVITAYTQPKKRPDPIELGVSTWQRPNDAAQPARVKAAGNYTTSRTARIEGIEHGYDEMVLLNQRGGVAEATAAALLVVRDGKVITPPPSEGCLESITVDLVAIICGRLNIGFERRPIDRSELGVVDEICIAGTLAELTHVRRFQWRELPAPGPVLGAITDAFWSALRRETTIPGLELTEVPGI